MILIKILINLMIGFFIILPFYMFFYFDVIPKLIGHYRRFVTKRREYDKEIKDIENEQ